MRQGTSLPHLIYLSATRRARPLSCCLRPIAKNLADGEKLLYKYLPIGSLFYQRPAGHDFLPCCLRLIAKNLADGEKLLYKYFFAIDNVDTSLCDVLNLAACEVVDCLSSVLGLNIVDAGSNLAAVECECVLI